MKELDVRQCNNHSHSVLVSNSAKKKKNGYIPSLQHSFAEEMKPVLMPDGQNNRKSLFIQLNIHVIWDA